MMPMRRQPGLAGPDMAAMAAPMPLQFAAPPPMPPPDASGAAAIGGLANMALAMQDRMTQAGPAGGAGAGAAGALGGGPLDAPIQRRKTPFNEAAGAVHSYA